MKEAAEPGGDAVDVTPEGFAVRSLAQEYGGGAFAVQGDVVVFSNYSDQRLYKQTIGGTPNKPRHCSIPYSLLWIIVGELDYSSSHCSIPYSLLVQLLTCCSAVTQGLHWFSVVAL